MNDATNVFLMFLLIFLNIFHTFFNVSVVDFEQVNVSGVNVPELKASYGQYYRAYGQNRSRHLVQSQQ